MTLSFNATLYVGGRELMVSIEATYSVTCDPYYGADADGNRYEPQYEAVAIDFLVCDSMGRSLTEGVRDDAELSRQMAAILEEHAGDAINFYTGER